MYDTFAKYYDVLTNDVDYKARSRYISSVFKRFGSAPTLLLDLACGTGGFSNEFAAAGVQVIGVDASEEMLAVAQTKTRDKGLDVMYLCQNAAELDLYGTVNGAVSCLDSLNHITDYGEFCEVFVKVSLFLEKNALFVFDMNTEYKHESVLSDNTFVIEEDSLYCVWQNFYNPENKITDITLDFFEKSGGSYKRSTDCFSERAYTDDEIISAAKNAGLKILAIYGDMTFDAPLKTEERKIFVAQKI